MLLLEALGSALLGLALAAGAVRLLARRLPAARVVLTSGVLGALFGAWLTGYALGPGHASPMATLAGAVLVSAVVLSLLLRPGGSSGGPRRAPYSLPSRG
ncbi:hypothetical protein [Streptomyces globosus]|uniref:hypothetical protein n=1 Tax=Streptomyces globosus TaxID=68209 RepID=UPI003812428A